MFQTEIVPGLTSIGVWKWLLQAKKVYGVKAAWLQFEVRLWKGKVVDKVVDKLSLSPARQLSSFNSLSGSGNLQSSYMKQYYYAR